MNPRDVSPLRAHGPRGLETWLERYGKGAAPELDALCRQKDAHTSLLFWFTELPAAIAEARRSGKPILSLRLLGNLDEELSCANSRFFRKLLYPDARINALLREGFVLHWQSVRPVPVVTIDFGGGKKLTRTLTGNSVHLVLDPTGRPVDALPGLMRPEVFLQKLETARRFAAADRRLLPALHEQESERELRQQPAPPPMLGYPPPTLGYPTPQPPPPPVMASPEELPPPSRAFAASAMAMSKHMVEAPILRAVTPLDLDTQQNLALHRLVHDAFAMGSEWSGADGIDGLVEWIYAELFLMPLGDPALGLDVPDPFSDLDEGPTGGAPSSGPPPTALVGQPTLARQPPPTPPSKARRLASTIARRFTAKISSPTSSPISSPRDP